MIINDPIADMLTRIRNALVAKHDSILVPASNEKKAVAKILLDEGFVKSVDLVEDGVQGAIEEAGLLGGILVAHEMSPHIKYLCSRSPHLISMAFLSARERQRRKRGGDPR